MQDTEQTEQNIIQKIKDRMKDNPEINFAQAISEEIEEANYLAEEWQKVYAKKRIGDMLAVERMKDERSKADIEIRKRAEDEKSKADIEIQKRIKDDSSELLFPEKSKAKLVKIQCNKCGHIGNPEKWEFRIWVGLLYLFTLLNIVGVIFYFALTNPYICENCGERDQLVKIKNNRKTIPIKSLSKKRFRVIAVIFLILGIIILVLKGFLGF